MPKQPSTDDASKEAARAELKRQNAAAKKAREPFSRGVHPRVAAIKNKKD
ncbi:hypothetical protein [Sulfitobacter sp. R18_1]|nr:hypothetical protein [Sulfitobacter sp. R18_1]MBO9428835.1 hypothetical protein [Sulfitobacter sp. R18_1]